MSNISNPSIRGWSNLAFLLGGVSHCVLNAQSGAAKAPLPTMDGGGTSSSSSSGGGAASTSGASGPQGSDGGTAGPNVPDPPPAAPKVPDPPPAAPVIANCDSLSSAGTWEDITPPAVKAALDGNDFPFAFAVDPAHAGTVYLGTVHQKMWKTTDCGATWVHINTGRNGGSMDGGMQWTMVIDPQTNDVITNNGYAGYVAGNNDNANGINGIVKSTNGGVDFDLLWPPANDTLWKAAVPGYFANTVAMEPNHHLHLLLSFHQPCAPPHQHQCLAESKDGGTSWSLIEGDPSWSSDGEGIKIGFLEDDKTWFWGSQSDGLWRTTNSGVTWLPLSTIGSNHLQSSQFLRAKDGTFLIAGFDALFRSPQGSSAGQWTTVANVRPLAAGVVSDGTTIYASTCYYFSFCDDSATLYFTAKESDTSTWTAMASPKASQMKGGGVLGYDVTHRILYSSNLNGGFWRVVTP